MKKDFQKINEVLSNIGSQKNLIEEVKNIYTQVNQKQKLTGRSFISIIGAIYFMACKRQQQRIPMVTIAELLGIEERKIKKAIKFVKRNVVGNNSPEDLNNAVKNYITIFSFENKTKVDVNIKNLASQIGDNIIKSQMLEGRNTKTIVALSLMMASNVLKGKNKSLDTLMKKDLVKFASEATLDKVFDIIKGRLDLIIPDYKDDMKKLLG